MSMAAVRRVVKKVQASRTLPESRCVVDCKRQQWKRSRSLSQTKWMQLKCHCFYTKRITEGFCDSQRRFCHVSVGHPGSWHDSRAYRLSEIFLSCSIISPRQVRDFFSNTLFRLSLSLLWRSKSGRTSDSRAAVLLSECASKTSRNVDLVCLLCISVEGIAVEGPGCSSGRGCSWELVACAVEDFGTVVWDEGTRQGMLDE
ncbi:uncharacterized protein LOC127637930 isoform X3 [Xyrauchen texanus]|uniref:uncharacterized protein LOC127637930 isoform X3 n=1 Tax=Xyrauchen texanus TaxID=154827 RepID=UPI002241D82D|nr:uncharacterized protein LOC127637930 isoform X3 [Xyrauchen texanus]